MPRTRETESLLNARIGERVRRLRRERKLSVTEIEARTGGAIRASHLSNLERNRQMWQAHHLEAVAGALGVDPRDLLPAREEVRENPPVYIAPTERELLEAVRAGDAVAAMRALLKNLER